MAWRKPICEISGFNLFLVLLSYVPYIMMLVVLQRGQSAPGLEYAPGRVSVHSAFVWITFLGMLIFFGMFATGWLSNDLTCRHNIFRPPTRDDENEG